MTHALTRAKRYPFARPEYSFVFAAGRAVEIVETGSDPLADCNVRLGGRVMAAVEALDELGVADAAPLAQRTAVLGYGSNAAPEQLARKFHDSLGETVIPVLRARLADHDVVYSAHFARYGSIAATLAVSPGTTVDVAVLYLGPAELARIHDTELGVYDFGTLDDARLAMWDAALPPAPLEVYLSRHGGVAHNGAPLALAEIAAQGRRFSALSQEQVLDLARDRLAPDQALDSFLATVIDDNAARERFTGALRACAVPLPHPRFDRRISSRVGGA